MNKENLLQFLKELKYSTPYSSEAYVEGSCFRLYSMLKALFPTASPLYSQRLGHWVTEINGSIFDINGELNFDYIQEQEFEFVIDEKVLQSAYVPIWKGQCTSYNKYIKTV